MKKYFKNTLIKRFFSSNVHFSMPSKMDSLIKRYPKIGLNLEQINTPEINRDEILIKIHKTAICGTDIHIWNWDEWAQNTIPIPMTVGHEYCGKIIKVGSDVKGLSEGSLVSGEGHLVCGFCRNCRAGRRHLCRNTSGIGVNQSGCFAEYLKIPATNAFLAEKNWKIKTSPTSSQKILNENEIEDL